MYEKDKSYSPQGQGSPNVYQKIDRMESLMSAMQKVNACKIRQNVETPLWKMTAYFIINKCECLGRLNATKVHEKVTYQEGDSGP